MQIGYARTSTLDQSAGLDAQARDLTAAGCERVFSEQVSAKTVQRPQLAAALDFVRNGDVLVVTKPDRLARSTADLLRIVEELTGRRIGLVILSMSGQRLDTRNPTSKLMLTMLAAVAEFERDLMLERQREGISEAAAAGKYKGRAPTARRQAEVVQRLRSAGTGASEIARQLGISRASVYRILSTAKAAEAEAA